MSTNLLRAYINDLRATQNAVDVAWRILATAGGLRIAAANMNHQKAHRFVAGIDSTLEADLRLCAAIADSGRTSSP